MFNRHEKLAVFNLSVVVTGTLLFVLIWQTMGIGRAYAGFAVIGFTGIGHVIFLKRKDPEEIIEDERDISIRLKSFSGSFFLMSVYFVIASLIVYFSHSQTGVVSVDYFPVFVWVGWAVNILASSVITLVQYRRGTSCGTC